MAQEHVLAQQVPVLTTMPSDIQDNELPLLQPIGATAVTQTSRFVTLKHNYNLGYISCSLSEVVHWHSDAHQKTSDLIVGAICFRPAGQMGDVPRPHQSDHTE